MRDDSNGAMVRLPQPRSRIASRDSTPPPTPNAGRRRPRGQYPAPPQLNYRGYCGFWKWPNEVPESGPWIWGEWQSQSLSDIRKEADAQLGRMTRLVTDCPHIVFWSYVQHYILCFLLTYVGPRPSLFDRIPWRGALATNLSAEDLGGTDELHPERPRDRRFVEDSSG